MCPFDEPDLEDDINFWGDNFDGWDGSGDWVDDGNSGGDGNGGSGGSDTGGGSSGTGGSASGGSTGSQPGGGGGTVVVPVPAPSPDNGPVTPINPKPEPPTPPKWRMDTGSPPECEQQVTDFIYFQPEKISAAVDKVCKTFTTFQSGTTTDEQRNELSESIGKVEAYNNMGIYFYAKYDNTCTFTDFTYERCREAYGEMYTVCWAGAKASNFGGFKIFNCLRLGMWPHAVKNGCDNLARPEVDATCLD